MKGGAHYPEQGHRGTMTAHPTPANHGHWWVYDTNVALLHALPGGAIDPADEDELDAFRDGGITVRAVCSQDNTWWWPGIASRMGLPRCPECCNRLNIPHGSGAPCNDPCLQLQARVQVRPLCTPSPRDESP